MLNITQSLARLDSLRQHSPALSPDVILALDEAKQINSAAESELDVLGLMTALNCDAEGSPECSMPELLSLLRKISQCDLALNLGYILTTFMAVTNIWVAGSGQQRQHCNQLLAAGKKIAIAYHELEHGNDFAANQLTATAVEGGYLLQGCKEVVNNVHRAGAMVLQARTSDDNTMRNFSLFFIDMEQLAEKNYRLLPRFATQGVRSCQIAGIEFEHCFIPASCLLGQTGHGISYALKAFQITRALLPGISLGNISQALSITYRYCLQRHLYGDNLLAIAHVRDLLSTCILDYLLSDNLSYLAARALHQQTATMSVLSALCKAHIPLRMRTVLKKLAVILGSRYFLREGEAALFEKIMRDYPVVSLGHASSLTCQASLLPQLPMIFKKFIWPQPDLANKLSALFSDGALPPFAPTRLALSVSGQDLLFNSIHYWPEHIAQLVATGSISEQQNQQLQYRLNKLHHRCLQLSATTLNANHPSAFDAVTDFAWCQTAMATLGRWCFDATSPFAGHAEYLQLCLDFILAQWDQDEFHPDPNQITLLIDYLKTQDDQ